VSRRDEEDGGMSELQTRVEEISEVDGNGDYTPTSIKVRDCPGHHR